MRIPYFFKAKSRIGLVTNPNKQKGDNLGVEYGADFILDYNFLHKFNNYFVSSFDFPNPELIKDKDYFRILVNSLTEFKDHINRQISKDHIQIVIGGDHSVSIASFLAFAERIEDIKKIGYIHFDSHGDINLYKESPSKNFHGMYLRPLFDTFDIALINNLLPEKLPTENLLIIGNLDLDEGEFSFIGDNKIKTISRDNFLYNKNKTIKLLANFVKNFQYLHVSFDGDVLDKKIFKATGIPCENGYKVNEILEFIKIIAKHPKFAFDIAEYNPKKDINDKAKKIIQEILIEILK